MTRFYTYLPLDFDQAFKSGNIEPLTYQVGCHLAAESYRAKNTEGGLVTAYVSALAQIHKTSPPTIRRTLRSLREGGWIAFPEPEERQRKPWLITLTGLARESQTKASASPTASPEPPPVTQATASPPKTRQAATPQPERDSAASRLRHAEHPQNETKRNETSVNPKPSVKEELDKAHGKTTRAEDNGVDGDSPFSEAELAKMDSELREKAQAETRRRHEAGEW